MKLNMFLNRPLYYSLVAAIVLLKRIQKKLDKQLDLKLSRQWEQKFSQSEYFTYNLRGRTLINLYRKNRLSRLIFEDFEKQEVEFISSILKQGDIFVDVGANIGLFSLVAADIVGPSGLVISFEPAPDTFLKLKENIALNKFPNTLIYNIGLSDRPANLDFFISENGYDAWNSFTQTDQKLLTKKIEVPVSTLDLMLADVDKPRIRAIKIDVEGWEKFVIKGGSHYFREFSPVVMVEFTEQNTFNAGYPVHDIYDELESYGYQWYRIKGGSLVTEQKRLHYPYDNLVAIKMGTA